MSSERSLDKGLRACNCQAKTNINEEENALLSGNAWSCVRNNGNNAWYVNLGNGSLNNNNTCNAFSVLPSSDLSQEIPEWIAAESDCYKNKHSSFEAASFHFHLSLIYDLISETKIEYRPKTSTCFILNYPVYREVFAANYKDRIVHHYVAPMLSKVCEKVHESNGNVSHGNRIGHSTLTAADQIENNMKEISNNFKDLAYVSTMDMSGFFMSIDKEVAFSVLKKYSDLYYDGDDKEEKLNFLRILIDHCPSSDCIRKSDVKMWDFVPPEKSLFGIPSNKGLPIGNFYSQLVANLIMAEIDIEIVRIDGIKYTRFVDDLCIMAKTPEILNKVRKIIISLSKELKLKVHPKKFYIQPINHGVKFCGRVIKPGRIYISNRTVYALLSKIESYSRNPTLETAKKLLQVVNSYFGLMKNTSSFYIKKKVVNKVLLNFSKWLFFKNTRKKFVCVLKNKYKPKTESINSIKSLVSKFNPIRRFHDKKKRK